MNQEHEQPKVSKGSSFSIIWGFFLLLSLLAAGIALGGGWYLWRALQQSQQQVAAQTKAISSLAQQLRVTDDALDKQQDKLVEQQQTMDHLSALTNQRDLTLLLAEVEYLTRLANFSLHFERNIPQATLLLETANQRLQSINDTSVLKLRAAITQQLTQLQAVVNPDVVGLLLKLSALSGQVAQLPLPTPAAKPVTQQSPTTATDTSTPAAAEQASILRRGWDKTWGALKNIVVIKNNETPPVVVPVVDRNYSDQHLQLLMAQAQWGLIRQQQALYANSITQAIAWVTQHYELSAQPTKAMLDSLNQMAKVNIDPTVPDLEPSLTLIKQLLAQPITPPATTQADQSKALP